MFKNRKKLEKTMAIVMFVVVLSMLAALFANGLF